MGAPADAEATILKPELIPRYVPIPGAAQAIYLYYNSILFLSWDVEMETQSTGNVDDAEAKNNSISLRLFVDGQVVDGTSDLKNMRKQFSTTGAATFGTSRRHYAGHCVLTPADFPSFTSAGWHKAEIRIAHQQYQIRVTTRRFNVIALKA